jgi:hypothetical protein
MYGYHTDSVAGICLFFFTGMHKIFTDTVFTHKFSQYEKWILGPGIEPLSAQSIPPLSSWATRVHVFVIMFSYK